MTFGGLSMKGSKKAYSFARFGYFFSIPFVLGYVIFSLYPILYTFTVAFSDLKGLTTRNYNILWDDLFKNFKTILSLSTFRTSILNTVYIWILNFIPQMALALLIASWFTDRRSKIKGQGFFKVVFYMPNIITAATVAILFNSLFGYPKGPVNDFLVMIGAIDKDHLINFALKKSAAQNIVIFIQTWMWYGQTSIVLMAGILGISPELFEAAEVDGANQWQTFWKITIPNIKTIMLFTLITSLIGGLNMFDIPYSFLAGGPDNATLTAAVFIYNQAFAGAYMYARAAAASIIMFVIICILSAITFYLMRDKEAAQLRKEMKAAEKAFKAKMEAEGRA